jgi:hypothetical protein
MSSPDEFSPEDLAHLAEHANMMYAEFREDKRSELYSKIIEDTDSPFREDPTSEKSSFKEALTKSGLLISNIVDMLTKDDPPRALTDKEKRELYHVILHHMYNIRFRNQYKSPAGGAGAAAEGGRRKLKRRKSTRRKSTRRKSMRQKRNTH